MSKHVILVDDDQDDAEIFSDALSELSSGYTLSHFYDGIAALSGLQSLVPADIIFLDVNMPKIDGWQCLREIKNISFLKDIPIVMYSTSAFTYENFTPGEVGAAAFLTKPDDFGKLKERLRGLFERLL